MKFMIKIAAILSLSILGSLPVYAADYYCPAFITCANNNLSSCTGWAGTIFGKVTQTAPGPIQGRLLPVYANAMNFDKSGACVYANGEKSGAVQLETQGIKVTADSKAGTAWKASSSGFWAQLSLTPVNKAPFKAATG